MQKSPQRTSQWSCSLGRPPSSCAAERMQRGKPTSRQPPVMTVPAVCARSLDRPEENRGHERQSGAWLVKTAWSARPPKPARSAMANIVRRIHFSITCELQRQHGQRPNRFEYRYSSDSSARHSVGIGRFELDCAVRVELQARAFLRQQEARPSGCEPRASRRSG